VNRLRPAGLRTVIKIVQRNEKLAVESRIYKHKDLICDRFGEGQTIKLSGADP
jgi:hypothetical protein